MIKELDLLIVEECLTLATKQHTNTQGFLIASMCCVCNELYDTKTNEQLPLTQNQKQILNKFTEDRKYIYSHGYCLDCYRGRKKC